MNNIADMIGNALHMTWITYWNNYNLSHISRIEARCPNSSSHSNSVTYSEVS